MLMVVFSMGILNRLFGWHKEPSALAVLSDDNKELRSLLLMEKRHSHDLLERITVLENKLLGLEGIASPEPGNATPQEQRVMELVKSRGKVCSRDVAELLGLKFRESGTERLSKMTKKGLLKRIGSGRFTAYKLA